MRIFYFIAIAFACLVPSLTYSNISSPAHLSHHTPTAVSQDSSKVSSYQFDNFIFDIDSDDVNENDGNEFSFYKKPNKVHALDFFSNSFHKVNSRFSHLDAFSTHHVILFIFYCVFRI